MCKTREGTVSGAPTEHFGSTRVMQAALSSTQSREQDTPPTQSRPPSLLRFGFRNGWPPRVLGAENVRHVERYSSLKYFKLKDQRNSLKAALAHPEVPALLEGRWEVLGCALVHERA